MKWFKDGQLISKKDQIKMESTFVFNISEVTKSSQGMYQCFLENEQDVKQASGQLILSGNSLTFSYLLKHYLIFILISTITHKVNIVCWHYLTIKEPYGIDWTLNSDQCKHEINSFHEWT